MQKQATPSAAFCMRPWLTYALMAIVFLSVQCAFELRRDESVSKAVQTAFTDLLKMNGSDAPCKRLGRSTPPADETTFQVSNTMPIYRYPKKDINIQQYTRLPVACMFYMYNMYNMSDPG